MDAQSYITIASALTGTLVGGSISAFVLTRISGLSRRATYYSELTSKIERHNWSLMTHGLDPGLLITDQNQKVSMVCYQHLNLLLYVWLNKDIVEKNNDMAGWKSWADSILEGAKDPKYSAYKTTYAQILKHGDLFPFKFLEWLDSEMNLSHRSFDQEQST